MTDNSKGYTSSKTNIGQTIESNKNKKKLSNEKRKKTSHFKFILAKIFIIIFTSFFLYFIIFNKDPPQNLHHSSNKILHQISSQLNNKNNLDLTCPSGFYLPTGILGKKVCQKCSIENCDKCYGNKIINICSSCMSSYLPILDKKKRIERCIKMCETGENEKCLICNKNKCDSCNLGYKLVKGKCLLNYSFKALYKIENEKENIILINKKYSKSIIELIIDKQKVIPSFNHTFKKIGGHVVTMLLNNNDLDSGKMMFFNVTNLISIEFTPLFETINMTSFKGMFKDCLNLKFINLSYFKTNNVSDFSYMFDNCKTLSNINISHFDTRKARDISYIFSNCTSLSSILLDSFNTSKVEDMTGLFYGCSYLTSIDLTHFDTHEVKYMLNMFGGCSSLRSIDISNFDTKQLKDISFMFEDCSLINEIDLNIFNTQNIYHMDGLFKGCKNIVSINLKNFITKSLKSADKMFYGCKKLKKLNISSFQSINKTDKIELFDKNISDLGEIEINKKFYNQTKYNIPTGWKIIFV